MTERYFDVIMADGTHNNFSLSEIYEMPDVQILVETDEFGFEKWW